MLFFQDAFVRDARDLEAGISALTTLKKRYGNTITTTLWRFVEQSQQPMLGGISCHPHRQPAEFDPANPFRYFVGSRQFQERFSNTRETEIFQHVRQYSSNARGGPLGATELVLNDNDGSGHIFHFETFFNQHDALTLGIYRREHSVIVAVS
jgi:hypothetical protein